MSHQRAARWMQNSSCVSTAHACQAILTAAAASSNLSSRSSQHALISCALNQPAQLQLDTQRRALQCWQMAHMQLLLSQMQLSLSLRLYPHRPQRRPQMLQDAQLHACMRDKVRLEAL